MNIFHSVRTILLFFILILSGTLAPVAFSQNSDSLPFEAYRLRQFDQAHIDTYTADPDYRYVEEVAPQSLWAEFMQWLSEKLAKLFDVSDRETLSSILGVSIKIVLWALGIFAVAMLIYSLLRFGSFNFIVKKHDSQTINFRKLEEQVLETDWAELIAQESAAGRYNTAVHLLFLQTLQILHRKSLIVWEKNKTASDYRRELIAHGRDTAFSQLSNYYNYAWFGDAEMDSARYSQIEQSFNQFNAE